MIGSIGMVLSLIHFVLPNRWQMSTAVFFAGVRSQDPPGFIFIKPGREIVSLL